jgi:hypothetical protein
VELLDEGSNDRRGVDTPESSCDGGLDENGVLLSSSRCGLKLGLPGTL